LPSAFIFNKTKNGIVSVPDGPMPKKKAKKKPSRKKSAPKPDVNQIAARVVSEATKER
jgi:hypothetical protein